MPERDADRPTDGSTDLTVRGARATDVARLYEICLRTGAAGSDATGRHDPLLLGDVYVGPYLALCPDLAFVLAGADDVAVGYVLGVADTTAFEERCRAEWWPGARERHPVGSATHPGDAELVRLVHEPERTPSAVTAEFPAHLHIDLLPEAQGSGGGRRLVEHLVAELRRRGVPGVHLGVDPENLRARGFYAHLGFRPVPPVADAAAAASDPDAAAGHLLGLRLG
ncbi:GNAT family N-acetyltransferase [Actinotalea sp. AC32]|nr:GNAT family N-acetyltransferase [Actinotalea sp. AC32]